MRKKPGPYKRKKPKITSQIKKVINLFKEGRELTIRDIAKHLHTGRETAQRYLNIATHEALIYEMEKTRRRQGKRGRAALVYKLLDMDKLDESNPCI